MVIRHEYFRDFIIPVAMLYRVWGMILHFYVCFFHFFGHFAILNYSDVYTAA